MPVNVKCYDYYEIFPDTGQETICRKRFFSSGCLNYVYGEGKLNYNHVRHHPPPRTARAPPARCPTGDIAHASVTGVQEVRRHHGHAAEGNPRGGARRSDADRQRQQSTGSEYRSSKYPDYTREEEASIFNLLLRRIQGWHKLNGELKTDFGTGVKEWAMKQVYNEVPPTSYPNIRWRTV